MKYRIEVIHSKRKTISIEISDPEVVTVRCPRRCSDRDVMRFLKEKELWIYENLAKMARMQKEAKDAPQLSPSDIRRLAEEAAVKLPPMVRTWAERMGVTYGRITIRNQKTRWGSCSAKGNLNFNCLLMLQPEELQTYVVIHELAHRLEMNHSNAFWDIVSCYDPAYKIHRKQLKEAGLNRPL
ncbi:MAG: M48 family metallopeptidase [Lachnospiraceae bacterium]|nr:M48 family metallopeptidase [Lachnospiraceae bacterium]